MAQASLRLSERSLKMPGSGIRMIMEIAFTMKERVYRLEAGEPGFRTPEHVLDAAKAAADAGFTKYTPNAGIEELRKAVAGKVGRVNRIQATMDNVLITTGGVGALFSTMVTILNPGDEVLIPDPGWPNVSMMLQLWGNRPKQYPLYLKNDFAPKVQDIEPLVGPNTKAIVINNPSNPTGANFPEAAVHEIVDFALSKNIFLVSDEVYDQIVYDRPHVSAAAENNHDNIISVYSFSKTYAMTGFRIGYLVAEPQIVQIAKKLQEPSVSCSNSLSQKAAVAALSGPQDCVPQMVGEYRKRRNLVIDILKRYDLYKYTPQGAFYILVSIEGVPLNSYDFAKRLLTEKKTAVAPGGTFGKQGESYVRLSLASPEEDLIAGTETLCQAIREWRK